jgi:spore coat polysaccharide biosynthesis protein SpsF (cytidylyltransferase family)/aryl-alcohol dehydrogenase-like predicted oxidoreductase
LPMSSRRIRIVLQARTTAKRLPAKVLLPLGGLPLAVFCARRLANKGNEVVLATSSEATDDLLAGTAAKASIRVFRGSLSDVLNRFVECTADLDEKDVVVRATADNPLPDGAFIEVLTSAFNESDGDYLGTFSPADGLPYGLSAEVFTVGALRRAAMDNPDPFICEHVTAGLRREAGSRGLVPHGLFLQGDYSDLRVTIDTLDDYIKMASLFERVPDPVSVSWKTLVDMLRILGTRDNTIPSKTAGGICYGVITLGTAQLGFDYGIANRFGCPGDEEASHIFSSALLAGVTHLDTARAYGNAEARIGQLEPRNVVDRFRVITKLCPLTDMPGDTTAREISCAVDASVFGSCRDLHRYRIDAIMFHRSSDMLHWRGAALSRLVTHIENGVIGEIGASVYSPEEAIRCLSEKCITHLQMPFNLLDSRWLDPDFQHALNARPDVKVHVRSVFLQGLLLNSPKIWPEWVSNAAGLVDRLESLRKALNRKNKADLCIAYVRAFPWVTSLVIGVERTTQVDEILILANEPSLTMDEAANVRTTMNNVPDRLINPSLW